jgi:A/G-specific adenine glycosylase
MKLSPFQLMIVELLLKKTRAETAEKVIKEFVKEFPSNNKLRKAHHKKIYSKIACLGLGKQRTRAIREISNFLHNNYKNKFPNRVEEIEKIPHLGMYIKNAIMCFAFNQSYSILDVNTSRIISRFYGMENSIDLRRNYELQRQADELVPRKNVKEYNWGLLDLGAQVCRPKPLCNICPVKRKCNFFIMGN